MNTGKKLVTGGVIVLGLTAYMAYRGAFGQLAILPDRRGVPGREGVVGRSPLARQRPGRPGHPGHGE